MSKKVKKEPREKKTQLEPKTFRIKTDMVMNVFGEGKLHPVQVHIA